MFTLYTKVFHLVGNSFERFQIVAAEVIPARGEPRIALLFTRFHGGNGDVAKKHDLGEVGACQLDTSHQVNHGDSIGGDIGSGVVCR